MMRQYIGARYTPKFMGTYDPTQAYEALSVVDNGSGTSYICQEALDPGIPLTDPKWHLYGASSGAIVNLQQQINDMKDGDVPGSLQEQINTNASDITALSDYLLDDLAQLKGKTIAVYGSSNEIDGSSGPGEKNWVTLMSELLDGVATVVNKSINGGNISDSVTAFIADPDRTNYDIILFTSVRNLYNHSHSISDLIGSDTAMAFGSLYSTITSIKDYVNPITQDVYIASCLPIATDFNTLAMCNYDGVSKRACIDNNFKMLDMHSWLNITNAEATTYTRDGAHFLPETMPILAHKCIKALLKGGEDFKNYSAVKKGTDVISWGGIDEILSGLDIDSNQLSGTYVYTDLDLNMSIKFAMVNNTGADIAANTELVKLKKSLLWYPQYLHNIILSNEGAINVEIRNRTGTIQTLSQIAAGQKIILYRDNTGFFRHN